MARIATFGLWHLGCVAAAALSQLGHTVVATDPDPELVGGLQHGIPPLYEPGLTELIAEQRAAGRLSFASWDPLVLAEAEYAFVTFDIPVDENDRSDLRPVECAIDFVADHAPQDLQIVIMSQVPIGTCRDLAGRIRKRNPELHFSLVYQPENLRLGEALKTFLAADVIVLGAARDADAHRHNQIYLGSTSPQLVTSWESAEMWKHATNAFLATSISFINELSDLAEIGGADIREVVRAMRLDRRIGPYAFLNPGAGFGGGTLARDLQTLRGLGQRHGRDTLQLEATMEINTSRLPRIVQKLRAACGTLRGKKVALLGLTYKPGTSTLRRSNSMALARLLLEEGCQVSAFDPLVPEPREGTEGVLLATDAYDAVQDADAAIVMTGWPEFRGLNFPRIYNAMREPLLLDVSNFLADHKIQQAGIRYFGTGIAPPRKSDGKETA